jgi:hypothetical protein
MVQVYADRGPRRLRQITGDLLVVGVAYVVIAVAIELRDAISSLGEVGLQLDRSGRAVSQGADRAADAVGAVPAVGGALAAPFGTLSGAGRQLSAAGGQVTESANTVAFLVAALLIGVAVGYVAFRYLPRRLEWIREVAEVRRLLHEPDAAQLLAHRAVAMRPLRTLRRSSRHRGVSGARDGDAPADRVPGSERAGRSVAEDLAARRWAPLAALELDALGLDPRRLGPSTPVEAG